MPQKWPNCTFSKAPEGTAQSYKVQGAGFRVSGFGSGMDVGHLRILKLEEPPGVAPPEGWSQVRLHPRRKEEYCLTPYRGQ